MTNEVSFTSIITQRCSFSGGSVLSGCPQDQVCYFYVTFNLICTHRQVHGDVKVIIKSNDDQMSFNYHLLF